MIIIAVEVVIILAALAAAGVFWLLDKKGGSTSKGDLINTELDKNDVSISDEIKENKENYGHLDGYRNIALFGVDSRSGVLGKGTLSDSIIVASINETTKEVKLVSVYRDTYWNLGDDKYNKANNAYSNGGPQLAISMLNMNLDLNITDYATVDFKALVAAIDELGGVTIDVKSDEIEHLNNYTVETSKVAGKKTNKLTSTGEQLLDGVQAVSYCRIRYTAGDDFRRTERQRHVIEKIIEKAKNANPKTLVSIIEKVFPMCATSMDLATILDLGKDVASYKIVDTTGFPFEKKTATLGGKGSCVVPINLEKNVEELHTYLFGADELYTPSETVQSISKKVINDTGIQ